MSTLQAKSSFNKQPGWSLGRRDPTAIKSYMPLWGWFYKHYFRVTTYWEPIPPGPVIFVGSHNGGIVSPDLMMLLYAWFSRFGTERPVYGLMHPKFWQAFPEIGRIAETVGAIAAHPKMALAALDCTASLLIYPGGAQDVYRPYCQRNQIYLNKRTGFIKIALQQNVPIVPIVSTGAHDTLFVLADIYPLMQRLNQLGMPWFMGIDPEVFPIYFGLPWGLGFGPIPNIPLPSQISLKIGKAIQLESRDGNKVSNKEWVDICFEHVKQTMQLQLDSFSHQINH